MSWPVAMRNYSVVDGGGCECSPAAGSSHRDKRTDAAHGRTLLVGKE